MHPGALPSLGEIDGHEEGPHTWTNAGDTASTAMPPAPSVYRAAPASAPSCSRSSAHSKSESVGASSWRRGFGRSSGSPATNSAHENSVRRGSRPRLFEDQLDRACVLLARDDLRRGYLGIWRFTADGAIGNRLAPVHRVTASVSGLPVHGVSLPQLRVCGPPAPATEADHLTRSGW